MKITIHEKHTKIGDSLKSHIETYLKDVTEKYLKNTTDNIHVLIEKEGKVFKVEVIVHCHLGNKPLIKSTGHEYEAYRSFNIAGEKLIKQLKRYKNKIQDHKHDASKDLETKLIDGTKYIISPLEDDYIDSEEKSPAIIQEKTSPIENLTVKDAVMQMDLLNLPALVFVNSSTKKLNVVYYRKDDNISWIDTKIIVD
ncbi:MAG: ribosomal subunit interface protein [Candidatus Midichloriaceae bacterium]|jgi:ribosomal subunit interface protein